jgi:hypothetical protein
LLTARCACSHFEPNGTHWNQVGSLYNLSIPGDVLGYQGWDIKISGDGLTVLVGDPLFNHYAGSAALYARASTSMVGGTGNQQFELRARHALTPEAGDRLGVVHALNGDGTEMAFGRTCTGNRGNRRINSRGSGQRQDNKHGMED